ncbi:hypothetical protein AGMMS50293_19560 [Spirochaetia bacterium]|nr:hypothetical protein AGMMS50293_19560 [Spirochaetia bacterium]
MLFQRLAEWVLIQCMVDFIPLDRQAYIKLLPMVPGTVFEMNKNNYCE